MVFFFILEKILEVWLLLIGYGGNCEYLEGMLKVLVQGNFEVFIVYVIVGDFVDILLNVKKMFCGIFLGRVIMIGFLEYVQLKEIFLICSLFIIGFKVLEFFGMVLVEVMFVGVLLFCYDYIGIFDVIEVVKEVDVDLVEIMCIQICVGGKNVVDGVYFIEILLDKVLSVFYFLYLNGFIDYSKRREVLVKFRDIVMVKFFWDVILKKILE